jgi:hypothetical protein
MKTQLLSLLLALISSALWSCTDQCKETRITRRFTPVSRSLAEIRSGVKVESTRTLVRPGKIYVKGSYLFINELKEGIHIVDNSNPAVPQFVSFIRIPGNGDIAVRNNILYADSYMDLVAMDISDPANPREINRIQDVFKNGQFEGAPWFVIQNSDITSTVIQDHTVDYVTETITTNCEETTGQTFWTDIFSFASSASFDSPGSGSASSPGGSNGQGGSMARFTLYDKFLYTVGQNNLHLFDVTNPSKPVDFATINVGWNIETIFPYKDKLFLGSSSGMFILDNADPAAPKQLSVFQHGRACDPVVVHDDIAYVTLRTGNACAGSQNQMDLVDVSNAASPKLIKTYQMENPHGLSIDFPTLYLCEGDKGLKVFDVSDKMNIDQHLLSFQKDMHAYDVISLGKTLLLIGDDGFYQFDASDPKNLRQISKIPVKKAIQ